MSTATFATFAARATHAALLRLSAQLRRASKHPGDAEAIHDLRVSIRRYTQCLRTFEDLFDPGRVSRIRKRLRALMTCCGEVRNCDIAVELLRAARLPKNNPAHASLRVRRAGAEAALVEHLSKKRWTNFARRNRLRLNPNPSRAQAWDVDGSVAANAHAFLPPMCADFFAAGSAAAASREDFETLHQFRLRAKRFRYTLELFGEVYGSGIERRLRAIRALQNKLGDLNDCLTTMELMETNAAALNLVRRLLVRRERAFRDDWQSAFAGKPARLWGRWLAGRSGGKFTQSS